MTRRQTIQKQAVLAAVKTAHPTHPTAADIFASVRPFLPTLSFGTVYRVLHGLAEEGTILEVPSTAGPTRFDADTFPHHHVLCTVCGAVGDVYLERAFTLEECARPQTDFEIGSYRLDFRGLCPACRVADSQKETKRC